MTYERTLQTLYVRTNFLNGARRNTK